MWRNINEKVRKLTKKKDGSVDTVAMSLIAILVMSVVFVLFISSTVPIKKSTDADAIARKYMLKMEQNGYLTPDNETAMISDFNSIGISNIDISGTTLNQVNYGEDVYLYISYKYPVKNLVKSKSFIPYFQNVDKTINIKKSSTSKKANY